MRMRISTADQRSCGKIMSTIMSVSQIFCPQVGGDVTIIHNALDSTAHGIALQRFMEVQKEKLH